MITREQFDYQRRAANAGQAADAEVARERERERSAAAGAALLAASAAMQQAQASTQYQIVQPVRQGVTAMWSGRQTPVQTITGQFGYSCEYNYLGKLFARVYTSSCPATVQVE